MDNTGSSGREVQQSGRVAPGPEAPDRRSTGRIRTVCRVARVRRADDIGLWRVRNISDEGLMLEADVAVSIGEQIEIALSERVSVEGRIVWAREGRYGVEFLAPIDASATLRELAEEQRAEGYRALRLPVAAEAILILHDGARPIDLIDISQSGAGFRFETELDPGSELKLLLPGGEVGRQALVRWSRGNRGGLWFRQPLERTDLESLARYWAGWSVRE